MIAAALVADTQDTSVNIVSLNLTFLIQAALFLILLAILGKWVFPPIVAAATLREREIEGAREAAEAGRAELHDNAQAVQKTLDDARETARATVSAAQRDAARDAEKTRGDGRDKAQATFEAARKDVASERDQALTQLREQVATLVAAVTVRVSGVDGPSAEKAAREVVK